MRNITLVVWHNGTLHEQKDGTKKSSATNHYAELGKPVTLCDTSFKGKENGPWYPASSLNVNCAKCQEILQRWRKKHKIEIQTHHGKAARG